MTTHFLPLLCTINQSNTHTHSLSLSLEHSKHTLLLPHKCLVGWCGKFQWLLSFFFLFGGVFCLECHPEFRYWANDAPILCVGVSKRKVANRRPTPNNNNKKTTMSFDMASLEGLDPLYKAHFLFRRRRYLEAAVRQRSSSFACLCASVCVCVCMCVCA